ncbi:MAG: hypothetical protein MI861_03550 [Pirellulales bacterium]|nr:hypothetical protein [Pirellulales bacterium]
MLANLMPQAQLRGSVFLISLLASGVVTAQVQPATFQYRHQKATIAAASEQEPWRAEFSSAHARDHLDTAANLWAKQKKCVSCHTHGIYMIVRPALSKVWGKPAAETREFLVEQFERISRGDHSYASTPIQMAYIARGLAEWDNEFEDHTSHETDAALRLVLSLQAEDGSVWSHDRWPPINSSTYHGTVMTAIAMAQAPRWQASVVNPQLRNRIDKLRGWLRDTAAQNDHERTLLLWASTFQPDLIQAERREALIEMVWGHQQPDGGWSLRTFATPETLGGGKKALALKSDPNYLQPQSDGYQTGLAVVVLRDAGIPADDPRLLRAIQWLKENQRESGRWWTRSLNTQSRFHFIAYSGSAYASLALAKCNALAPLP